MMVIWNRQNPDTGKIDDLDVKSIASPLKTLLKEIVGPGWFSFLIPASQVESRSLIFNPVAVFLYW